MRGKLKKSNILLIIAISILTVLVFGNIPSNATDHGKNVNAKMENIKMNDTFNISYTEYANNVNRLLCIEHGQKLKGEVYNKYKVKAKVKIEGDSAEGQRLKDGKVTAVEKKDATGDVNGWNARLAAAIHYTSGEDRREAMWYYFSSWVKKIGNSRFGISNKWYSDNNDGLKKGIIRKVNNYVSKVKNGASETDAYIEKMDSGEIVTQLPKTEKYRSKYVKVGPFKFDFEPQLDSIKVKGIFSGKTDAENIGDIKFVQSGETFEDVSKIKSEQDFYILVPNNVTKITKITLKTKETTPMKAITANIAILVAGTGSEAYQNLAIVETSAEPGEPSSADFTYDTPIVTTVGLSIEKVDKDNNAIKLSGVGFKFKHKQLEKWVKQDSSGKITYVSEGEATTFVTDAKGEINIKGLLLGEYELKEVTQPNYGYKLETTSITLPNNTEKIIKKYVTNKQAYIKLSGRVWIDEHQGKTMVLNEYLDSNDKPAVGVRVYLKDSNGNVVHKIDITNGGDAGEAVALTDSEGKYSFEGIETDKIDNYHVEFEYNGLTYQNVTPGICDDARTYNIYAPQASKAIEGDSIRDNFNKTFSTVENGGSQTTGITKDTSGNKARDLTYSIAEHKATLINNGMLDFGIIASTANTEYSIKVQYETQKASNQVFDGIENINLGLYEREQPDIAVVKDIQSVKVVANNKEHVYEYANRFKNINDENDPNNSERFGVEYGSKFKDETYERAIYKADYENAIKENNPTGFEIYITYKIAIRNESTNLTTQVNSIVDYYDTRYSLETIGNVYTSEGGKVSSDQYSKIGDYSNGEEVNADYQKTVINLNNMRVRSQKTECVYVQFKLGTEGIKAALDHKGDEKELFKNIAEVNSYSIFSSSDNIYAGIDKDSAPGNVTPGNKETYEDDTDTAPAMKLLVTETRTMEGTVFLDHTDGTLKIGESRLGDGEYTDQDQGINDVEITLIETTGSNNTYTTKTSGNGEFKIEDYIAGDYQLTYTWGGQKVNVDGKETEITLQDYKATIYKEKDRQTNTKWHLLTDKRYSDAFDDMDTRQAIDDEIKTTAYNSTYNNETKMNSTTPKMDIGLEYDTLISDGNTEHVYQVKNIDFGIVRRPKQSVELTKQVKAMKVTLANGEIVSDVQFTYDKNGNMEATGEKNHVTYMGASPTVGTNGEKSKTETDKGFVKVELDNELLQGATIEVTYEFKFKNNSELDYVANGKADENYYKYGETSKDSKLVTIKPSNIIDYLDNDWGYEANKNTDWEAITKEELKTKDFVDSKVYRDESDIDNRIILYTDKLSSEDKEPGGFATVDLSVSKTLTTTDDITLNNETEIIKLDKTGGSRIINITPGNYVPGQMPQEPDTDVAEEVIVTPSTGANLAYVLPVALGIGLLAILGTGIVLIKKKVLGNKE